MVALASHNVDFGQGYQQNSASPPSISGHNVRAETLALDFYLCGVSL